MVSMSKGVRVELKVDADLLTAVDGHVSRNPGSDRGAVIDDALRLWLARQRDLAMERQLRADAARNNAELTDWRQVRNDVGRRRR
jgi:metal-responsive CopG/Arc/MetJ family transcriptional regulator